MRGGGGYDEGELFCFRYAESMLSKILTVEDCESLKLFYVLSC